MGKQLDKDFYDKAFSTSKKYKKLYSKTPWFPIWVEISNILKELNLKNILELGCGPGQLAHLLIENNEINYLGIDFSKEAIKIASKNLKKNNLKGIFLNKNINDISLNNFEYDCVIATEFLEHINNDIEILNKIKNNTIIIGTLPNKDSAGHVRFYPLSYNESELDIKSRYKDIGDFLYFKKIYYSSGKNYDYLFVIKRRLL